MPTTGQKTVKLLTRFALALSLGLVGCGSGAQPQTRYIQALQQKFLGNAQAYYDQMLALANGAPHSRAGRRARATVVGDDRLSDLLLVGLGATFLTAPDAQAATSGEDNASETLLSVEAQTQLRLIAASQKRFHRQHDRFCATFIECDTPAPVAAHYFYFLSDQTVAGGSDSEETVDLEEQARLYLNAHKINPTVTADGFTAVAIGVGSSDEDFDVWTIDEAEQLVHLAP
jgi:hypothetical protein